MAPAVFIARLIGPVFVVIGVGILLNQALYAGLIAEAVKNPTLIYLYGVMVLSAGLAILNVHRAWSSDWRVVITVLGWLLVIGGVVRIVLPQVVVSLVTNFYSGSVALPIVAVIVLVVGGFLSFKGYRQ